MDITKNEKARRFETVVDGETAFLRYHMDGDTMHLLYVEVPPHARGRGIAAELTSGVLAFAEQNALRVVPVCPYISAYLERHPEYARLVANR